MQEPSAVQVSDHHEDTVGHQAPIEINVDLYGVRGSDSDSDIDIDIDIEIGPNRDIDPNRDIERDRDLRSLTDGIVMLGRFDRELVEYASTLGRPDASGG